MRGGVREWCGWRCVVRVYWGGGMGYWWGVYVGCVCIYIYYIGVYVMIWLVLEIFKQLLSSSTV